MVFIIKTSMSLKDNVRIGWEHRLNYGIHSLEFSWKLYFRNMNSTFPRPIFQVILKDRGLRVKSWLFSNYHKNFFLKCNLFIVPMLYITSSGLINLIIGSLLFWPLSSIWPPPPTPCLWLPPICSFLQVQVIFCKF